MGKAEVGVGVHARTQAYQNLQVVLPPPPRETKPKPKSKSRTMRRWVNSFKQGAARRLCLFFLPNESPKGQLAVYVADEEGDTCRVLVPVVYFNHPLFGELLEEAEKEYGFNHEGGIKIPCPKSRLESVQMKIAAGGPAGRS